MIESTLFSTEILPEEFYLESIETYLSEYYQIDEYEINHRENGVIPLGKLAPHDPKIPGLGIMLELLDLLAVRFYSSRGKLRRNCALIVAKAKPKNPICV